MASQDHAPHTGSVTSAHPHTPGPWVAIRDKRRADPWRIETADKESWVADVKHMIPAEEYEANARLIAAAPEMFEYIASSASNGCATARALIAQIEGKS